MSTIGISEEFSEKIIHNLYFQCGERLSYLQYFNFRKAVTHVGWKLLQVGLWGEDGSTGCWIESALRIIHMEGREGCKVRLRCNAVSQRSPSPQWRTLGLVAFQSCPGFGQDGYALQPLCLPVIGCRCGPSSRRTLSSWGTNIFIAKGRSGWLITASTKRGLEQGSASLW